MTDSMRSMRRSAILAAIFAATFVLVLSAAPLAAQSEIEGTAADERSDRSTGFDAPELLPAQKALLAYNAGLRQLKQAEKVAAKAVEATSEKKREKYEKRVVSARERAVAEFTTAIKANAEYTEAFVGLGTALASQGKYNDALGAFNRALDLEPGNVPALAGRGEVFLGLNQVREAAATYSAIQPEDPERAEALMSAIKTWAEAHRADPAGVDPQLLTALEQWLAQQESG